jgi:hypothetical protein
MQRGPIRDQGKAFLQRLCRSLQGFMRKRDFDVFASFETFGDDVGDFVVGARERAEGLKQHHLLDFFGKGRGIKQTHAAAEGMAHDGQRFFF